MSNMEVVINMNDGRIITITSDKGRYNKVTYDCFFEENVRATDEKTLIEAANIDLLATDDTAKVYNDVVLTNENGSLMADKINYDFTTRYYKISMFDSNKRIKMKEYIGPLLPAAKAIKTNRGTKRNLYKFLILG